MKLWPQARWCTCHNPSWETRCSSGFPQLLLFLLFLQCLFPCQKVSDHGKGWVSHGGVDSRKCFWIPNHFRSKARKTLEEKADNKWGRQPLFFFFRRPSSMEAQGWAGVLISGKGSIAAAAIESQSGRRRSAFRECSWTGEGDNFQDRCLSLKYPFWGWPNWVFEHRKSANYFSWGEKTENFKSSISTFSELPVSSFLAEITIYFYRSLIVH